MPCAPTAPVGGHSDVVPSHGIGGSDQSRTPGRVGGRGTRDASIGVPTARSTPGVVRARIQTYGDLRELPECPGGSDARSARLEFVLEKFFVY